MAMLTLRSPWQHSVEELTVQNHATLVFKEHDHYVGFLWCQRYVEACQNLEKLFQGDLTEFVGV